MITIAGAQERFNSDIEADRGKSAVFHGNIRKQAADLDVPLLGFVGECHGADLGVIRQGPVLVDPNHSDVLNPQPVAMKPYPITVGREYDAGEAVASLEARIARFLPGLDPAEECLKCLVKPAHGRLGRAEVKAGEVVVGEPLFLKPGRLLSVLDAALFRLVGALPLFKAGVVQATVSLQHDAKLPCLIPVRPESVFEGSQHCYRPF